MASRFLSYEEKSYGVFDLSTEHVIAYARFFLASIALAAIYADPTQPARYAQSTYLFLTAYLIFASLAVAVAILGTKGNAWPITTHILDVAAGAILMHLTEGPTSPFFLFSTFTLLSATLRWDWRGALPTAALQIAILALVGALDPEPLRTAEDEVNRVIMRGAYLLVLGLMLGAIGAYRSRSQDRFAKLAAWPAPEDVATAEPNLNNVLRHVADVMRATTVIVAWEEKDEPYFNSCVWDGNAYEHDRKLNADASPQPVAPDLTNTTFVAAGGSSNRVLTAEGVLHRGSPVFSPELEQIHAMRRVAAAPFEQGPFRGHVFAVNCRRVSDGLLPLIEIVADRIGIELEHHRLRQQSAAAEAARQRIQLAGQVHDGVLQSLTAASLHLRAVTNLADGTVSPKLKVVADIVGAEQRRVRHLVDSLRPKQNLQATFRLATDGKATVREIGRLWQCETRLNVTPDDTTIPSAMGDQLYLILAEAIANAVRHGHATQVVTDIRCEGHTLDIRVDDNGAGFPEICGEFDQAKLEAEGIGPTSLRERAKSLGGGLSLVTGADGAGIRIRLPV